MNGQHPTDGTPIPNNQPVIPDTQESIPAPKPTDEKFNGMFSQQELDEYESRLKNNQGLNILNKSSFEKAIEESALAEQEALKNQKTLDHKEEGSVELPMDTKD